MFQNATLPAANTYMLPTSPSYSPQSSIVVPGQVWSLCDVRDAWAYSWTNTPAPPITSHPALLWQSMAKNLIQPSDMRFGWVVLYRRDMVVRPHGGRRGVEHRARYICAGDHDRRAVSQYAILQPRQPADAHESPERHPESADQSDRFHKSRRQHGAHAVRVLAMIGTLNLAGLGTRTGYTFSTSFAGGPSYINFVTPPAMAVEVQYVVICDDNLSSAALYTTPGGGGALALTRTCMAR